MSELSDFRVGKIKLSIQEAASFYTDLPIQTNVESSSADKRKNFAVCLIMNCLSEKGKCHNSFFLFHYGNDSTVRHSILHT